MFRRLFLCLAGIGLTGLLAVTLTLANSTGGSLNQPVRGNLVDDTSPQLGGDLDLNGKNLDFPTTANISDVLDEDNMTSDSATVLATQQSIKAYADLMLPLAGGQLSGNVTMAGVETVDGRDISTDGTKLDTIADNAEVNPAVVSQVDAEAGTATDERIWTAVRVKQAIAAFARTRELIFSSHAKVGATGGWVLGAANDLAYLATIPQSQTNSTLIVPISGIEVGETITAFCIVGQIESGGGAVTITGDLRVLTAVAADVTDASVSTVTTGSKTADYLINDCTTGISQAVASGETYYIVVKGTTAGTTDAVMIGTTVTLLRD